MLTRYINYPFFMEFCQVFFVIYQVTTKILLITVLFFLNIITSNFFKVRVAGLMNLYCTKLLILYKASAVPLKTVSILTDISHCDPHGCPG